MKKYNIIYYSYLVPFLGVWIYFEIYVKSESLYWLVAELIGTFLVFFSQTMIKNLQKKLTWQNIIGALFYGLLMTSLLGYRDVLNYKRNVCQAKFGREFNGRRRSLGVPEIPTSWHISYRGDRSFEWQPKDSVIGHESKYIVIDSNCSIKYEDDEYDFKRLHGKSRDLTIHFEYARGKAKDSIFFWYNNGDTTRTISRQISDSILDAEKIKKDY